MGRSALQAVQLSGWAQYVIPVVWAGLLSGAARVCKQPLRAVLSLAAGTLLTRTLYDLATVKFGMHPAEPMPGRTASGSDLQAMLTRRSCRSFRPEGLNADDRQAVRHALRQELARQAPRAGVRLELIRSAMPVWSAVGCRDFLVAVGPARYDRTAIIELAQTLQTIVTGLTRLGFGTCWIGPGRNPQAAAAALGDRFDPNRDHVVCVCAVGHPSRRVPLFMRVQGLVYHRRHPATELFFEDGNFTRPIDSTRPPLDRLQPALEACRWAPSSLNAQPTRAIVHLDRNRNSVERVDFWTTDTRSRFYAPIALGIWLANWQTATEALGLPGHFERRQDPDSGSGSNTRARRARYDVSWKPCTPASCPPPAT